MVDQAKHRRERRIRAHRRVRRSVDGGVGRPRLSVFKSLSYVYAQVIDDTKGHTIAQANSAESGIRKKLKAGTKSKGAARLVGETIGERAKDKGVEKVVFDRGGFIYHGKVREVAEGARSKGLDF